MRGVVIVTVVGWKKAIDSPTKTCDQFMKSKVIRLSHASWCGLSDLD